MLTLRRLRSFVGSRRGLVALGLGLALLNLGLWFGIVWLRAGIDALAGRLHSPDRPRLIHGVQELFVYFAPWLAVSAAQPAGNCLQYS